MNNSIDTALLALLLTLQSFPPSQLDEVAFAVASVSDAFKVDYNQLLQAYSDYEAGDYTPRF